MSSSVIVLLCFYLFIALFTISVIVVANKELERKRLKRIKRRRYELMNGGK